MIMALAKKTHYFEIYYKFLDSEGKQIVSSVWSSPKNITKTNAKQSAIAHSKKAASKGVEVSFPKPKKQVYKIVFYSFKRVGSGAKRFTKNI